MYESSAQHVFARIAWVRERAGRRLRGEADEGEGGGDGVDAEAEALAQAARVELRLPALCARLGGGPLLARALECLLAAEYEPLLRTVLRAEQREEGPPWLELGTLAGLCGLPSAALPELASLISARGALGRRGLVLVDGPGRAPVAARRVRLAADVAWFLAGLDLLPRGVAPRAPAADEPEPLLPEARLLEAAARVRAAWLSGLPLVVEISGASGTGKRVLAGALARRAGLPLWVAELALPSGTGPGAGAPAERAAAVLRQAWLHGGLPCLSRWDAGGGVAAGAGLPSWLSPLLRGADPVVILLAAARTPAIEALAADWLHLEAPRPSPRQRAAILGAALARAGGAPAPALDLEALARRHALDPARLGRAAATAAAAAAARAPGGSVPPAVEPDELEEACRRQERHELSSIADRVKSAARWEDLVVPVDVYHGLRELCAHVRGTARVHDEWGFAAHHALPGGVSALFAGPPGTGKTMCAQVMARELDRELYRVDLSRVVSRYLGETEKNLARVFDEAERGSAVLLFDEADALFARRTTVSSSSDRYANLEVGFLLSRMESFSGVTILTSNAEDTIDAAFRRRLTFRLRFERPDVAARTALWQKVLPAACPVAPDLDFARLAALYELSGGAIRSAALRAAFAAAAAGGRVDMRTALSAAERESRELGLVTRSVDDPRGG